MKRIVLLLGFLSLISCSSNDDDVISANGESDINLVAKNTDNFDKLFYSYVTSNTFNELHSKSNEFSKLLNFNGNLNLINTENKLFNWIESNISETGFQDFDDAVRRWKEIELLNIEINEKNKVFVSKIKANKFRFVDLWVDFNIGSVIAKNKACKDELIGCNNDAASQYADGMAGAWDALIEGAIDGNTANKLMNQSRAIYSVNLVLCQESFEACLMK